MRIFDENNIEIKEPDISKGYLINDSLFLCHHEATESKEEEGHYETVKEYPNGGKDVRWVVDKPAVQAIEAWDEYEEIKRYVKFTDSELAQNRITELKNLLLETDYHIFKIVEGAATQSECKEIIDQRAQWRKEINELEEQLKEGGR